MNIVGKRMSKRGHDESDSDEYLDTVLELNRLQKKMKEKVRKEEEEEIRVKLAKLQKMEKKEKKEESLADKFISFFKKKFA
jgi:hypothetical protein